MCRKQNGPAREREWIFIRTMRCCKECGAGCSKEKELERLQRVQGRAGPRGTQRNRREREVLSTPQEGHVVGAWSWKKSGGGVLDTRRKWRALMEPHPD